MNIGKRFICIYLKPVIIFKEKRIFGRMIKVFNIDITREMRVCQK